MNRTFAAPDIRCISTPKRCIGAAAAPTRETPVLCQIHCRLAPGACSPCNRSMVASQPEHGRLATPGRSNREIQLIEYLIFTEKAPRKISRSLLYNLLIHSRLDFTHFPAVYGGILRSAWRLQMFSASGAETTAIFYPYRMTGCCVYHLLQFHGALWKSFWHNTHQTCR